MSIAGLPVISQNFNRFSEYFAYIFSSTEKCLKVAFTEYLD